MIKYNTRAFVKIKIVNIAFIMFQQKIWGVHMNGLVNFDGLGEAIVNLTNKLADGVGWIANKENPKKIAIDTYVKEIQQGDYDPLTKAALISNARKVIKGYCNQKDIVEIAIQSLKKEAEPHKMEDDWLGQFMDKAKNVSSKEFKWIWGKILAKECNDPGSIPLALLHTLERMDKEDAESFTCLCRMSIKSEGEYVPVVFLSKLQEYHQSVLTLDSLVNLKALGLIELHLGQESYGFKIAPDALPLRVFYFDKEIQFSEKRELKVGDVIFTKSGQALCQSIDVEEIEGFLERYCLPLWN